MAVDPRDRSQVAAASRAAAGQKRESAPVARTTEHHSGTLHIVGGMTPEEFQAKLADGTLDPSEYTATFTAGD